MNSVLPAEPAPAENDIRRTPLAHEHLVDADRIKALKVALNSSFIANTAVGVMLAVLLASMFDWLPVLCWLGGLLLLQRYRRLFRLFQSLVQPGKLTVTGSKELSARRFEVDSLLLASYWGATGLWFFDGDRQGVQFAVAHALGGVSLVSLGVHAYHPRVIRLFLVIVNLPFILRCIAQMDLHHEYVGAGMLLMNIYLVVFGKHLSKVVRQALDLRYENTDLVAELKSQTRQLQAANEAKSRFLAAASHDLRQPVHAVGLMAAAVKHSSTDPHQTDLIEKLESGVNLFSTVVDEILDMAQLDAGAVPAKLQWVPLAPIIEKLDVSFFELAAANGLTLATRLPRDSQPCVLADPALLWRVLSNLVSNAIRYTSAGTILIAVRPGQMHMDSRDTATTAAWRIEVRDSGIGIPSELQAVIFEEFYQIANLQRNHQHGLGLGLAVAKGMADLMQARLDLRSRPAAGSVFSVTLRRVGPAWGNVTMPADQPGVVPVVSLQGLRVLVIDDDQNARVAMQSLLAGWQVDARVVAGPKEACAQIDQGFLPQALITDHWLADGYDAVSAVDRVASLLRQKGCAQPTVAVFSGDISLSTRYRIETLGWNFATKPVRPQELMRWLCQQALFVEGSEAVGLAE